MSKIHLQLKTADSSSADKDEQGYQISQHSLSKSRWTSRALSCFPLFKLSSTNLI